MATISPMKRPKKHCSYCNATSLQVAAGVLSGLLWILENPKRGVIELEIVDHSKLLEIAAHTWEN